MNQVATVFEFTSYAFEPAKKRAVFHYKTEFSNKDPIFWTETIILPSIPDTGHIPKEALQKLLESLHIILGISYYKFYCATNVKIPYTLSKQEADFWNTVYKKGLGEFFYKNNLNPNVSPKFQITNHKSQINSKFKIQNSKLTRRCLVGIGGGKDSIVTVELLKEHNFDITAFHVQTHSTGSGQTGKPSELVSKVIGVMGVGDLKIQRFLDQQVHQPHQYNGHIPISAIYAFLGVFACVLYKYNYFIVSNEHSSNFGSLNYKGLEINHQWSKSLEFETLFSEYVKNGITPDVTYFSLLRSFYEIRIVKMFCGINPSARLRARKYFKHFSSCNGNFKMNAQESGALWCGKCAKCVFAFTLLSAFLSKKELLNIFGKNVYQDAELLPLFKDILGFGVMKPFDCVGTFQEAQTALYMAIKKHKDFIACPVVKALLSTTGVRQLGVRAKLSPEVFITNSNNIPEQFKFLGMESALIMGYGKEGEVTKKYLKKYYPKLKIGIADAKQGSGYLKKQEHFDIAIKTPGIKKELITIPYTTATNMFFSQIQGKHPIIGITGSKGKSTTSTLMYEILKKAGKHVQFLGNIGQPMLQALLKPIAKDTIFVLELSSYQLDDIAFSPDIAIVTNLFEEHMDYHGNLKNYYEAKKNIINFQTRHHFFVYNPQVKKMGGWLKGYKGKAVPFVKSLPLKDRDIPLMGEHNKNNIKAAVTVAKILNIPEKIIKEAIQSFKALPHRLELVGIFKGITFYNDASSTNPESAMLAIRALKHIDTIFLGGQDRGYDFSELEKTIKQYTIKNVALFPDSGKKILTSEKGFITLHTRSMEKAVAFAYQNTRPGKICLLSGGSPSYSLWKNFAEKGDQFKKFVKKFSGPNPA